MHTSIAYREPGTRDTPQLLFALAHHPIASRDIVARMAEISALPRPTYAQQVAANVRAEAARAGVTQQWLARQLGLAQAALSERYRGRREFTLTDLERIAAVLRVELGVLTAPANDNGRPVVGAPVGWYGTGDSNPEPAD